MSGSANWWLFGSTEVDVERWQIRITRGKGSKDRQVPFPRSFRELLALHMEHMRNQRGHLPVRVRAQSTGTLIGVCAECSLAMRALPAITRSMSPHKWRHFLFTWLKKEGIDDALIQPYSGHATRQSLEIYSKLSLARRPTLSQSSNGALPDPVEYQWKLSFVWIFASSAK